MKDIPLLPLASQIEKQIFQSYETKNQSIYESQYVKLSETKLQELKNLTLPLESKKVNQQIPLFMNMINPIK